MLEPRRFFNLSSHPLFGRLLIIAAALLWSTSGAFVKSLDLPATTVAMHRTLIAGVLLLLICLARRKPWSFHPAMLAMMIGFSSMNYLYIAAMSYTTAANTIFLQYTAPLWITIGSSLFLGELVERRQWIAIAGTLIGVAIIVGGGYGHGNREMLGIGIGLASGFSYAVVAVMLRFLRDREPLQLAASNHLFAGASLLAINIGLAAADKVTWSNLALPTDSGQVAGLVTMGFTMGLPYVLFGLGLRTVSAQEAGLLTLIEPVLNPCWTYLATGETPRWPTIVGGVLLVSALMLRYLPIRRQKIPSSPRLP